MAQNNFRIDLTGIIEILSGHLYSSPAVFIRELLQNAVDAIVARRLANPNTIQAEEAIHVELFIQENSAENSLMISDNGIGLTENEMHEFLSVIGASSKIEETRSSFIGQFGIGLLSCFMVSDEIVVVSKSVKSDKTFEWRGNRNGTYSIKKTTNRQSAGTSVFLKATPNTANFYGQKAVSLVEFYGKMLSIPIFLELSDNRKGKSPEFTKQPFTQGKILSQIQFPKCTMLESIDKELKEEIFAFGTKELYTNPDVIERTYFRKKHNFLDGFYFESDELQVSGLLFFHRDKNPANRVYLKGMLVSKSDHSLLPHWAFFCSAIINSKKLRPTASREQIYEDKNLEDLQECLSKQIHRRLFFLKEEAPDVLREVIATHQGDMMRLAIKDETMFHLIFPHLKFETSLGHMLLKEYLNKTHHQIHYVTELGEFRKINYLKDSLEIAILNAAYAHAKEFIEVIPKHYDGLISIKLINVGDIITDTEQLNILERDKMEFVLENKDHLLKDYGGTVEIRKMEDYDIPVVYSNKDPMDRPLRRAKAANKWLGNLAPAYSSFVLYLNYNNPLVQSLANIHHYNRLKRLIELLYVYSLLLGQYPLNDQHKKLLTQNMLKLIRLGLR